MNKAAAQRPPQLAESNSKPMPSSGILQRQCSCGRPIVAGGECAECRKKRLALQRRAVNETGPEMAPPIVHDALRVPGRPLDSGTREFMESRFKHDFSRVRIHTGGLADRSAKAVDARAFTVGNNLVFRSGNYQPGTTAGKELLAHELSHTVQQAAFGGAVQPSLAIAPAHEASEAEADRVAKQVVGNDARHSPPTITQRPGGFMLSRVPTTPQRRGGQARKAVLEQPPRGEDQVRVHVIRYLCDCVGRNVSRSDLSAHLRPRPGIVYSFCRGNVTARVTGEVNPSSFSTGSATITGDVNVAPERGGVGGRVEVQGEARNTGDEPEIAGRVRGTLELPGGPRIGASGEVTYGTESRRVGTGIGVEGDLGRVRIFGRGTDLQDPSRRGVIIGVGGEFGGPSVQREYCRVCRCPIVYECIEDVPPRAYEVEITENVEDSNRLRYYFRLNTNQDARDPGLRRESSRMLSDLATLVADGWSISSITGYASPEFDRPGRGSSGESENETLSLSRGERLHEILSQRLGQDVPLPQPQAGGELLGRRATIAPGSGLNDAILEAGFSGPEEVSYFLIGEAIEDDQLADQFLALLNRVVEPDDRLRLFGISSSSPVAGNLLAAIEQFVASGGRGRRPWERIFEYLRFASVEVTRTRQETRTEQRRTRGSVRQIGEALCNRHAQQAESEGLFGPAEAEPTEANCPAGTPRNDADFADGCDYSR